VHCKCNAVTAYCLAKKNEWFEKHTSKVGELYAVHNSNSEITKPLPDFQGHLVTLVGSALYHVTQLESDYGWSTPHSPTLLHSILLIGFHPTIMIKETNYNMN
jgi:hypothetical protein